MIPVLVEVEKNISGAATVRRNGVAMGPDDVEAYGAKDGHAEVVFKDGLRLVFDPVLRRGEVTGLACVRLYRDGQVLALAGDGFWSSGEVTQANLASRCDAAVLVERQVYRLYRMKKIDEAAWQARFRDFWKVVIKCRRLLERLRSGSLRELEALPPESIEE